MIIKQSSVSEIRGKAYLYIEEYSVNIGYDSLKCSDLSNIEKKLEFQKKKPPNPKQ